MFIPVASGHIPYSIENSIISEAQHLGKKTNSLPAYDGFGTADFETVCIDGEHYVVSAAFVDHPSKKHILKELIQGICPERVPSESS
jgi:hypothetical protein